MPIPNFERTSSVKKDQHKMATAMLHGFAEYAWSYKDTSFWYEILTRHSSLIDDTMISIHVGSEEDDCLKLVLLKSLLCRTSDYFVKALSKESFRKGREKTLRFPVDDTDAWRMMVFWFHNHKLPDVDDLISSRGDILKHHLTTVTNCWIPGDKYGLSKLQNAAMMLLLQLLKSNDFPMDTAVTVFQNTDSNAELRMLVAEEVAQQVQAAYEKLDLFDSICGFASAFCKAKDRVGKDDHVFAARLEKQNVRKYLVREEDL